MEASATADVFLFEEFRLDRRGLFQKDQNGAFIPIAIGSRALQVLFALVERSGDLVSRDEISQTVWPGMVIEGSNLPVQIAALRRILDRDRADGSCIQTVVGRGYRFVATVIRRTADSDGSTSANFHGSGRRRLSIVVLPFSNVGNDPEQQYLADTITEDVTTDLSRIPDMIVISRNTAFTYRNRGIGTKQIGRELGVRYVLEGSVRRSGNQLRINTQLIDAESDAHLWAERFVGDTADLLALQDEITTRIAVALGSELIIAAAAQSAENPDTLDYIFRGRAALAKPPTRENYAKAIEFFQHALALDAQSVEAQSMLATAHLRRVLDNLNDSAASAAADIACAEALVAQVLALSPSSPRAHFAKGDLLYAQRRFAEAIPEYEMVLASNRNSVDALAALGWCKFLTGSIEEAIPALEQALRLSPRDRWTAVWCSWTAQAYLLKSRTDEAIVRLEKARSANPALPYVHAYLAAACGLKGEIERASAELAEARRLSGDDRYRSIARVKADGLWRMSEVRALAEATYLAGLRKAGMPEE
jgi:TolB-like protein/Flp pilus assembly protein TadD